MSGGKGPSGATSRVFVYGTLLSGEPNHALLAGARFVAPGRTMPAFRLHDLGGYPGLVRGGAQAVPGEVYEVDAETLSALDRLEEHPEYYRRERLELEDGSVVDAYLLLPAHAAVSRVVASGSWRERHEPC